MESIIVQIFFINFGGRYVELWFIILCYHWTFDLMVRYTQNFYSMCNCALCPIPILSICAHSIWNQSNFFQLRAVRYVSDASTTSVQIVNMEILTIQDNSPKLFYNWHVSQCPKHFWGMLKWEKVMHPGSNLMHLFFTLLSNSFVYRCRWILQNF